MINTSPNVPAVHGNVISKITNPISKVVKSVLGHSDAYNAQVQKVTGSTTTRADVFNSIKSGVKNLVNRGKVGPKGY